MATNYDNDPYADIAEPVDPYADLAEPVSATTKKLTVDKTPRQSKLSSLFGVGRAGRLAQGVADPFIAAAQIAGKGLEAAGVDFGKSIIDEYKGREAGYQQERKAAGQDGMDLARITGNIVNPATGLIAATAPATIPGGIAAGAAAGALTPSYGDNFASEKAMQVGLGGAVGGAFPALLKGAGKVISPAASKNPQLKMLQEKGINPTIGQALGGRWNAAEEKLSSVPVFGDMIARARGMAKNDFNKAVINEVTAPIGVKIDKIGQEGVAAAGDALSAKYTEILSKVKGIKFDDDFIGGLKNLKDMTEFMPVDDSRIFQKVLNKHVGSRLSPGGGMDAVTYNKVDSELGALIRKKAGTEVGDALKELQSLMRQQLERSNPEQAGELAAVREGWAKLVRLEEAAKSAAGQEGVFTPGQLLNAVKKSESSVRKRSVARGEGLMQDMATAGQNVLGNKYPDSGTVGRALAPAVPAYFIDPTLAAGIGVGSGAYTRPVQNALVAAVSKRPEVANALAKGIEALPTKPATIAITNQQSQ